MAANQYRYASENDNVSSTSHPPVPETGGQSQGNNGAGHKSIFENQCEIKTLKIKDIDSNVFMQLCKLFNIRRVLGGDYRTLAANLDYKMLDIETFSLETNPTEALLKDWNDGKGHLALHILTIVKEMNRDDVFQLLEKEILKITRRCNCQNCKSLCQ